MALIFDPTRKSGIPLTGEQIDLVITEQFTMLKQARSVVGGYKQVLPLRGLMYARAGLGMPTTEFTVSKPWDPSVTVKVAEGE